MYFPGWSKLRQVCSQLSNRTLSLGQVAWNSRSDQKMSEFAVSYAKQYRAGTKFSQQTSFALVNRKMLFLSAWRNYLFVNCFLIFVYDIFHETVIGLYEISVPTTPGGIWLLTHAPLYFLCYEAMRETVLTCWWLINPHQFNQAHGNHHMPTEERMSSVVKHVYWCTSE